MDDEYDFLQLQCDIELMFSGPKDAVLKAWAVSVLRKLAERIENDEFEDGHHDVMDNSGKTVGTIYIDYSGIIEFDAY